MSKRLRHAKLAAVLGILGAAVLAIGQSHRSNPQNLDTGSAVPNAKSNSRQQPSPSPSPRRQENKKPADPTKYTYEFSQPQFTTPHILIEHDALGNGKITFERQGESTPLVEQVELSTAALGRVLGLWSDLHFLDSAEDYQSSKQFPHLGTMKVGMDDGKRKRIAEFNWTNNRLVSSLANEYRRVADQAVLVFDLNVARENQPLNAPKLMDYFDSLLTRSGLSDPYQLVPLLREMTTDEHLPLIARNQATRLLKRIEK
ncbi:MAG TPA: hypothetical protein VN643_22950 [Pyrinomonadaceae bacterium]|nr:hypothetical protein [Pyrinomonadaceae bacterium]